MEVRLLIPRNKDDGHYLESVAIFAARRCRTTKEYGELWAEVDSYSSEKRTEFLHRVVTQDWAADVLEMIYLVYDIEGVPVWLIVELLRHRLIAREFSLEQLSQRAIAPFRLKVEAPTKALQELVDRFVLEAAELGERDHVPPEQLREVFPQGVLVNFCIGGNMRAFHHFFWMRSSPLFGGKGGAHIKFQAVADKMQDLVKGVLPITMDTILRA